MAPSAPLQFFGVVLTVAALVAAVRVVTMINDERTQQLRVAPELKRTLRSLSSYVDRVGIVLTPKEFERWAPFLEGMQRPEFRFRVVTAQAPAAASDLAASLFRNEGVRRFVVGSGETLEGASAAIKEQRDDSRWCCAAWFGQRAPVQKMVFRGHPSWEVTSPCIAALLAPKATKSLWTGGGDDDLAEPALFGSADREGGEEDAKSVLVVVEDNPSWRGLDSTMRAQAQIREVQVMLVRPDHRDDRLMERLVQMAETHAVTDVVCALGDTRMAAYVRNFPAESDGALVRARHLFAETVLGVREPRPFMLGQRCLRFATGAPPPEPDQDAPWGHPPYVSSLRACLDAAMADERPPPEMSAPPTFDVLQLQEVLGREVWRLAQRVDVTFSDEAVAFVGDAPAERLVRCRVSGFAKQGLRVADLGGRVSRYMNNTCQKDSVVDVKAVDAFRHKTVWRGTVAQLVTDVRMHVADSTRIRFENCRGGAQVAIMGLRPGQRSTIAVGAERECMNGPDPEGCMWRQPVNASTAVVD